MVNWGYRVARLQGKYNRWQYYQKIQSQKLSPIPTQRKVTALIYALSCERDLPEQVASIRSFLTHVGIPQQFFVISDGSYTPQSCEFLQAIHSCVRVIDLKHFAKVNLPSLVYRYAELNPMGKKLATLLSLPNDEVALYVDSDILFFPAAWDLARLIEDNKTVAYYLPDETQALDNRLIKSNTEMEKPINGGFVIFKKMLDWSIAMQRFLELNAAPNYFSEQTMLHLTLHHNDAIALNSQQYIMRRDDEFVYRDRYADDRIILRHYVSPIRHKFWCNWQYLV
ncbi:MAG: hypothetical protein SAJ12_14310 [Jaaginema sp. PMC 1079.18]|nr:hypothetical protein [Jaaginema sp. PMC 1080.18]MEC4852157.1 hypothetical protein [Jaaginema sp. PMC 1079.18]MEC4867501.1 hypothetical protein [Jaaginema sp. PMC 1078.18]